MPVVIFDEIGLADISMHNPLKVLHNLLELNNKFLGFVGISNWRLIASKMNRAVYLARLDSDLKFLAMSIYISYFQESLKHQEIINNLALSYYKFKDRFKHTANPIEKLHSTEPIERNFGSLKVQLRYYL